MKVSIKYLNIIYFIRIFNVIAFFSMSLYLIKIVDIQPIFLIIIFILIGYAQFFVVFIVSEKILLRHNLKQTLQQYYQRKTYKTLSLAFKRYTYLPYNMINKRLIEAGFEEIETDVYEKKNLYQLLQFFFFARPIFKHSTLRVFLNNENTNFHKIGVFNVVFTKTNLIFDNISYDLLIVFDDKNKKYSYQSNIKEETSSDELCIWYYMNSKKPHPIFLYSHYKWNIRLISALLGSKVINP